ncbi:MAG: hypothetical protein M5T61_03175 [Acidimicrobiia bacterium]|nr:hypothetical protein [Acidimicrobiia bacterium]
MLRRSLGNADGPLHRRRRAPVATLSGPGVLMNPRDRLAPARRLLGAPTTLWAQPSTTRTRLRERIATAHVYVDVSGSMTALLPHILGLLLPYVVRREADVYQFSTEVVPLPLGELRSGKIRTTLGTSIPCVLNHMLAAPLLRRALVLTDGYVGAAPADLAADLASRDIELNVVLPHESQWASDLEPIAHSVTVLPPIVLGGAR